MKIIRLLAGIFLFLLLFRFLARGVFIFAIIFGLIMIANKAKKASRKRKRKTTFDWVDTDNDSIYNVRNTEKRDPETQILLLAAKHNGSLTLADISMHTELPREKTKKIIKHFSKIGVTENKMSDKGVLVYCFPLLPARKMMIDLSKCDNHQIEKSMMKLATVNNNRISLAGIALNTTLTTTQAFSFMEQLYSKGTVAKEVGISDAVIYYFTEILSDEEKNNAKDIWV